jgi:membrane fusion protein, copper/silver efflux system
VQPGSELFEIVDLRRVWVMASVPESDAARLKTGQRAQFTVAALPGQTFAGQVQFLYPALDAQTRTLQARMELDNPALELRPGMSGDMRIEIPAAETLTVPVEALVDTGEAQYVFLARGGGRYQPRAVRPGSSDGNRVQILEGLSEGDVVVTASSFLVDSESRLRAAIEAFAPTPPEDETQDALAQHTR